jgi:N-acetylglucosamine malate deacetylase 1
MKILGIGAHPDDIELFMYGFLSICKNRGDSIFLAVATDGSAGGVNLKNDLKFIRKEETINALELIGKPEFFNFEDGALSQNLRRSNLIRDYILDLKPDLIVTHDRNDYHADHRALSKFIIDIASFSIPVLFCETLMGINFEPDYYIDISKFYDQKISAILAHKSQNPTRLLEIVETMNKFRALQCNAPQNTYAETYKIVKQFPFVDIRDYIPQAIKIRKFNLTNQT